MKMFAKSTVLAGVTAALLGFSMSAAAATNFTGNYAVGNWTQIPSPPSSPPQAWIDLADAPFSITLIGADDQSGNQAYTRFTYETPRDTEIRVSFNWTYTTADPLGWDLDQAHFVINGATNKDLKEGPPNFYEGPILNKNDTFGFQITSDDSIGGAATLTITNFNVSPVPEPGSLAMLTAGLLVVVTARKRKQT